MSVHLNSSLISNGNLPRMFTWEHGDTLIL